MDATTHDHHQMPTEGAALTAVSISATLHCLTGCAIGEVAGMVIGTAVGLTDVQTIFLICSAEGRRRGRDARLALEAAGPGVEVSPPRAL